MPIFNSPPGWPTPPAGWTPPQGWQPDPSWPPAPADHVWWTEDPRPSAAPSDPSGSHVPAVAPLEPAPHGLAHTPQLVMAGGQAGPQHAGLAGPGAHPAAYAALHELVPTQAAAPYSEQHGPHAGVPAGVPVGVPAQRPAPSGPTSRFGTPLAPADASFAAAQHGAPSLDLVAHYADEQRRAGRKAILVGVVMLLVGLGVTIGGYASADVGGSYVVLWGPVLVGLVSIVRGVVQMARAGEAALRRVLSPR